VSSAIVKKDISCLLLNMRLIPFMYLGKRERRNKFCLVCHRGHNAEAIGRLFVHLLSAEIVVFVFLFCRVLFNLLLYPTACMFARHLHGDEC